MALYGLNKTMLTTLVEDAIREMQGEVVVCGDFNAKAPEWGERGLDSRGKRVMNMVSRAELIVLNSGGK